MKTETLSIISYLLPLAVSSIGAITILSNRNRGVSRNTFAFILLILSYRFGYDLIAAMHIKSVEILAFVFGSFIWLSLAPLLYRYFHSLRTNDYTLTSTFLKHLASGIIVSMVVFVLSFLVEHHIYIEALNYRFQNDASFERNVYKIIIFILGSPVLAFQWVLYFYFLKQTIKAQQRSYGKFYGSYEQRNELLMKRIYFGMAFIFFISFCAQFFQLKDPIYIFIINLFQSFATIYIIQAAKEQIDMKKYRMYKLSSHLEEIKNNRRVNKLRSRSSR